MDIETLVVQVLSSGDIVGSLKTVVLPVLIAVAGHVVLNYMKSVKAGSLKKLHDTLAANHITLKESTLAEIDAASKKAEAVVAEAATTALNKILEDFMVKHNQSTKEIKEAQDALHYVVAGLTEKVDTLKKSGFDIADAVAAHKSVYSEPKECTVNSEQLQPLQAHPGFSDRPSGVPYDYTPLTGNPQPEPLNKLGDVVGQPGHGFITVGGPYGVTSMSTGLATSLLGVTSGYVDMSKAQGVQFSYTADQKKPGGEDGSKDVVESVQPVVPGTGEGSDGATTNTATSDITIPDNSTAISTSAESK